MIGWAQSKLSIRQAGYAITAIVVIASLFFALEIFHSYVVKRDRVETTIRQQVDIASAAAARAAFHVDDVQAATIVEGLFRFENLEWARITTDRGDVLAEHRRSVPPTLTDPLARYLFGDIASHKGPLSAPAAAKEGQAGTLQDSKAGNVGNIELGVSPELIGHDFLNGIAILAAELVVQLLVLGVTLAVIFHRTLTLPLLRYADALSRVGTAGIDQPLLELPRGHEHDEFGVVIMQTNQLLERINKQHQDLLHSEKVAALGTLLAGVSHELNNPLAILMAQSELLVETAGDTKTRQRGEKILSMTNRCVVIVRRFLALARRRDIVKEVVDIDVVIAEVLEILEYQLEQSGIEINITAQQPTQPILADRSQMTQALLNLIVNAQQAVNARHEPGQIAINVEFIPEDAAVKIVIADNGPGISGELAERIFEPFFTTKPDGQGTGLGLSYAKDVIKDHGGSLTVTTSQYGGAAFIVTVPSANVGQVAPGV